MLNMISLFSLAFAVSLDSFSVGLTYGLRKMKLPYKSILVLAFCSAITVLIAMGFGEIASQLLSERNAKRLGGFILIFIGLFIVYQFFASSKACEEIEEKTIVKFEIKSLGIVIQMLKKPMVADIDKSGTITGIEAVLLGVALSLDAFGAGIGAALLGYSPLIMAISVAVMSSVFVTAGIKFGRLTSGLKWVEKLSFLPGLFLIMLGFFKM